MMYTLILVSLRVLKLFLHYQLLIIQYLKLTIIVMHCHGLNHDLELSRILPKISQHT